MARAIKYKAVKNADKPGRPPAGSAWVKTANGRVRTNSKGELGYRALSSAELKAAKARQKKRRARKGGPGPGRPSTSAIDPAALLRKSTYTGLTYDELGAAVEIIEGLRTERRKTEKHRLQKEISALRKKLTGM